MRHVVLRSCPKPVRLQCTSRSLPAFASLMIGLTIVISLIEQAILYQPTQYTLPALLLIHWICQSCRILRGLKQDCMGMNGNKDFGTELQKLGCHMNLISSTEAKCIGAIFNISESLGGCLWNTGSECTVRVKWHHDVYHR
ncbi:hypothetical protein OG21DRAFT_721324 [Imleria badia]|nr:hypothetical protein OG21DRAFT_721324 [Imleria badia]